MLLCVAGGLQSHTEHTEGFHLFSQVSSQFSSRTEAPPTLITLDKTANKESLLQTSTLHTNTHTHTLNGRVVAALTLRSEILDVRPHVHVVNQPVVASVLHVILEGTTRGHT